MFIRQNADQYTTQMPQPQERRQAHLPQTETADWQIHKSAFEAIDKRACQENRHTLKQQTGGLTSRLTSQLARPRYRRAQLPQTEAAGRQIHKALSGIAAILCAQIVQTNRIE